MKRVLSLILVVTMIVSMAPVLAAGGNVESFWFAHMDSEWNNVGPKAVKGFSMTFRGEVLAVELSDFSNVRLTRDGVEVAVELGKDIKRSVNTYENGQETYFVIPFSKAYTEPGVYKLYATYQGVEIETYAQPVEGPLSDTPADPETLEHVWAGYTRMNNRYNLILAAGLSSVQFNFRGKQDVLRLEDLTELKVLRNSFEAPFSLDPNLLYRSTYYSERMGDIEYTDFHIYMKKEFTDPGVYKLTGKYRGKAFESEELVVILQAQLDLLDTAHYWAAEPLSRALAYGLVPDDISVDFSVNATRAEFCRMAVRSLEAKTGKGISEILTSRGKTAEAVFTDTSDPDILAAAALGIVNGMGGGIFAPNAKIERQQAAVLLKNLCDVIGIEAPGMSVTRFSDDAQIASWAHEAVNFVRSAGIMSGDGMRFLPKDMLSREQSAIVLANVLKTS